MSNYVKSLSKNDKAKTLQESYPDVLSDAFLNELLQFASFTSDENETIPDMFGMLKKLHLCSALSDLKTVKNFLKYINFEQ